MELFPSRKRHPSFLVYSFIKIGIGIGIGIGNIIIR